MKTRPWITVAELDTPTSIDAQDAVQAASLLLFIMSGQKYGGLQRVVEQYVCEETGAPTGCAWDPGQNAWWNPHIDGWTYLATTGIPNTRVTRLLRGRDIRLRHTPVRRVDSITIGDTLLLPSQYALRSSSTVTTDGSWGVCDGSGPVITYDFGYAPPALGRMAARRLANELVLAAEGSAECSLPRNVTSVARQGISFEIFNAQDFMDKGHTGLYEVDLFLSVVNPNKSRKRAKVFSPDTKRAYYPR